MTRALILGRVILSYAAAAAAGALFWWLAGRFQGLLGGQCTLCRPGVAWTLGSISGWTGLYLARHP